LMSNPAETFGVSDVVLVMMNGSPL